MVTNELFSHYSVSVFLPYKESNIEITNSFSFFLLLFLLFQYFSVFKADLFFSAHGNIYSVLWNEVLPKSRIENKAN